MPCAVTSSYLCTLQLASITEKLGTFLLGKGIFCPLHTAQLHEGESECLEQQKALCCEKNTHLILHARS